MFKTVGLYSYHRQDNKTEEKIESKRERKKIMSENFEYTYSSSQQKEVEAIRKKYLPKEEDKMETLRKLDRKAENPGSIAALITGIVGALVLGAGMSCCMVWAEQFFVLGIVVGILGMIMVGAAYPLYKKITAKKRAEYAEQILALTNELAMN